MMLFAAVAPSITHWLAAAAGAPSSFAQICGPRTGSAAASIAEGLHSDGQHADGLLADLAAGLRDHTRLPGHDGLPDHTGMPDHDHERLTLDHCPFCGHGGTMPLLMPPTAFVLAAAATTDAPPRLFLQARRPLFAWAPSHPRGPPSRS